MNDDRFIGGRYDPARDPTSPKGPSGQDMTTFEGAQRHAAEIMRFWHERGKRNVIAWVGERVQGEEGSATAIYSVKTNLKPGGLPPDS